MRYTFSLSDIFLGAAEEILAVVVLGHGLGDLNETLLGDPAALVGNLFQTGNLQPLTLLDDLDECRGLREGIVSAGVEPGKTALQCLYE